MAALCIGFALAAPPLPAQADGILMSWAGDEIPGMTKERWSQAKQQSAAAVLALNHSARTWADGYAAALGAKAHKDDTQFLRALAEQILDPGSSKLEGTATLIVWERIARGDLLFLGKGLQIDDDVFRISGRANWILRALRGKDFGHVQPDSTPGDLKALHDRWLEHLAGGTPPEWQNPYPTAQEGLSELRSKIALEALIVSLRPSRDKDVHTAACLHKVYGLDRLPPDPKAPAQLCSPDRWTRRYLLELTEETEPHDATWWSNWWNDHHKQLVWNGQQGRFSVPR